MTRIQTRTPIRLFAALLAFSLAAFTGCKKNADAHGVDPDDPAAANMAAAPAVQQPASNNGADNNAQPTQVLGQSSTYQGTAQGTQYPADAQYTEGTYEDQGNTQAYAGVYATQPPPAIPHYQQPPAVRANTIWTPGYWAYSPQRGYFWVPGAWVAAPYQGALWTPPYWQNVSGRYRFHPGYWGRHVGFYGGVSYGNGYPGRGYYGGYWNGPNFYYNRAVTNVGPGITLVYEHPAPTYSYASASWNGPGGVNLLPIAAELIAMHERHRHPVRMQYESVYRAGVDPAQFWGRSGRVGIYAVDGAYTPEPYYAPQPVIIEHEHGHHDEPHMIGAPEWEHGHFDNGWHGHDHDGPHGEWHEHGGGDHDHGEGHGHGHD